MQITQAGFVGERGDQRRRVVAVIEGGFASDFQAFAEVAARTRSQLGERLEVAGETAFYYCHDTAPLLAALADEPALRYLHRAASLEDVFIKLTGRELRD